MYIRIYVTLSHLRSKAQTVLYTVVWKTFSAKKILVMKFKYTNTISLQNFSYEIYLNFFLVSFWQACAGYI